MPPALISGKELAAFSIRCGNGPEGFHTQQEGTDVSPQEIIRKIQTSAEKERTFEKKIKTCVLAQIRIYQGTNENGSSGTSSKESDRFLFCLKYKTHSYNKDPHEYEFHRSTLALVGT